MVEKDIRLTYSQEQGYEDLPTAMAPGEINAKFRTLVWSIIYEQIHNNAIYNRGGRLAVTDEWESITKHIHLDYFNTPIDEYSPILSDFMNFYKSIIINSVDHVALSLIQIILRHPACPTRLPLKFRIALEKSLSGLVLIDNPWTFVPRGSEEEAQAVSRALSEIQEQGFLAARRHLSKSAELINGEDFKGAIREAIHAVESVARSLSEEGRSSLKPVIDQLEKHFVIHPAFKSAILKLYGYTSDSQGIRHAEIDESTTEDLETALFMFGACASFASYLATKGRKAGLLDS